jgi:hypothetical protein
MDTKIDKALKNKDIVNIMNYASRKFTKQLDADELYTCKINALWKCFLHFKPEKKCKFTTYLFKGVYIECLKAAQFLNKSKRFRSLSHALVDHDDHSKMLIDILDEAQTNEEREILMDKLSRMTNEELSNKYNIGKETIRKKVKKMTKSFRHKFV